MAGSFFVLGAGSFLAIVLDDSLTTAGSRAAALAIASAFTVVAAYLFARLRRARASLPPWSKEAWARFGYFTVLVWGVIVLAAFSSALADKRSWMRDWANAPNCGTPAPECRFRATGHVDDKDCSRSSRRLCALVLRFTGEAGGQRTSCLLKRADAVALNAGDRAMISVFRNAGSAKIEIGGRWVEPESAPANSAVNIAGMLVMSLGLIGCGVFGLVRLAIRRRRAQSTWR